MKLPSHMGRLVGLVSIALLIVACGGQTPSGEVPGASAAGTPTSAAGTPVSGGTVTFLTKIDLVKLHHPVSVSAVDEWVSNLALDPLVTYDEKFNLVPVLLKEIPTVENGGISTDGLTYTLRLRPEAKWHDGEPITSQDVVFTNNVLKDPKAGAWVAQIPAEAAVTAPDATTVVLELKQPLVGLVDRLLYFQPLPQHALSGVTDWSNAAYFTKPYPGSGPFKFVEWQSGAFASFERNPDYYRGQVYLDKVVARIIKDENAAFAALKTGEGDIWDLSREQIDLAKSLPNVTLYEHPEASRRFIFFNLRDPMLKDLRVRQALNYGLNRDFVKSVFGDTAVPLLGPLNPWHPAYTEPKTQFPFDPDKAKALLDEAGWKETTPGGIREAKGVTGVPDGTKLAFTVPTYNQGPFQNALLAVQQQWKAIGVQLDPQSVNSIGAAWGASEGKLQMALVGDETSLEASENFNFFRVHGAVNFIGLDTVWPEADDLLEQADGTLDKDERFKLVQEWQEKMLERAPAVFVASLTTTTAVNARLQNFKPTTTPNSPFWNAYEWWLQK